MAHHQHRDILISPKKLTGIANAAAEVIAGAQHAYRCGLFPPMIRDNLQSVQHDLIRLLAIHRDGIGYGKAPDDLVGYLGMLEGIASDLLEAADGEGIHESGGTH